MPFPSSLLTVLVHFFFLSACVAGGRGWTVLPSAAPAVPSPRRL